MFGVEVGFPAEAGDRADRHWVQQATRYPICKSKALLCALSVAAAFFGGAHHAQAQSAGCTGTVEAETVTDNPGGFAAIGAFAVDLLAGDPIRIDAIGGPINTNLQIFDNGTATTVFNQGFAGNGNLIFIITADGNYTITYETEAGATPATADLSCPLQGGGNAANGNGALLPVAVPLADTPEEFARGVTDGLFSATSLEHQMMQQLTDSFFGVTEDDDDPDPDPEFLEGITNLEEILKQQENELAETIERRNEAKAKHDISEELLDKESDRTFAPEILQLYDWSPRPTKTERERIEKEGEEAFVHSLFLDKEIKRMMASVENLRAQIEELRGQISVEKDLQDIVVLAMAPGAGSGRFHIDLSRAYGFGNDTLRDQPSPFSIWVTGDFTGFNDNQTGADRDGETINVIAGVTHRVSRKATIGGYLRYRNANADSAAAVASLDQNAFGVGVNGSVKLGADIVLGAATEYVRGNNDISIAGATGSFASDEFRTKIALRNRWKHGPWSIDPNVEVGYVFAKRHGYTNSAGTVVPSTNLDHGRLTFGPRIGYTHVVARGSLVTVQPHVTFNGIWNFATEGSFAFSPTAIASTADYGGSVGTGVTLNFIDGLSLSASGTYAVFDTNANAWSFSVSGAMPVTIFGTDGSMALGFTGSHSGRMNARARLDVPLN